MLTNGRPAFVSLTRTLLLSGAATVLPAPSCILEIGQDVEVDAEVIEACRRLQEMGYTLALDDYRGQDEVAELLPFVRFVKVDAQATDAETRAAIARRVMHRVRLIAEKVETAEVFEETKRSGYSLFQGYFFCRPTTVKSATPPGRRLTYLRLLSAINQPNVTLADLEELIAGRFALLSRPALHQFRRVRAADGDPLDSARRWSCSESARCASGRRWCRWPASRRGRERRGDARGIIRARAAANILGDSGGGPGAASPALPAGHVCWST